jgi:hypothetical protein
MENPASFLWIFVILGALRLPFLLYRRQQVRNNPARQAAGTQDITFRATILLRFKNPGRLLLSQHWYYGKASPIELIVRTSTFQVTRWSIGRSSHRYGSWFFHSSETTMWLATMRFFPLGPQECIVVSGSYPWRNGERQVELAMATRGRSQEMWAALASSGVRPLSGPGVNAPVAPPPPGVSYGMPKSGFGAPPQLQAPAGAPGSALMTAPPIPGPYVPNFESLASADATQGRNARRTAVMIGGVLCLPFLVAFLFRLGFAHIDVPITQSAHPVTLAGPTAVARVSGASCTDDGHDLDVAGTISAAIAAPSGIMLSVTMAPPAGGTTTGLSADIDVPGATIGVPREFRGVVAETGALPATDACVISWALSPLAPPTS